MTAGLHFRPHPALAAVKESTRSRVFNRAVPASLALDYIYEVWVFLKPNNHSRFTASLGEHPLIVTDGSSEADDDDGM